ncbi:hypothetical transcript [Echinococcus multilocularis]|uniref:Hypothetical transcript n=1 Tax=Echinococcus multilocularis TaxID=6211 RepID=A0A068Y241_ECHMU|nr:hypothetical transcript [Echinococcus multilocularis]
MQNERSCGVTVDMNSLENYNILADHHLAHYFNSPRVKQHLIKSGLITPGGEIVPEKDFRSELTRKSRQEAALKAYIWTMTDKAVENERTLQSKLRRSIEDIRNSQRIRKIRAERRQKREREMLKTILFDTDGLVDLETEEERIFHNTELLCSPVNKVVEPCDLSKGQSEKGNGHFAPWKRS